MSRPISIAFAFASVLAVSVFADDPLVKQPASAPFVDNDPTVTGTVTPDQAKVSTCTNCPADQLDQQRAMGRGEVEPSFSGGKVEQGVNLFTGQAVTTLPLETIGDGFGLGYPVVLAYASPTQESFAQTGKTAPSGWVGYGWNLQFPSVVRNHKGTVSGTDDVYFGDFGLLGGGQILPGAEQTVTGVSGADRKVEWRVVGNPGLKVTSYRLSSNPSILWWQVDAQGGMSMVLGKNNRRSLTLVNGGFEVPLDAGTVASGSPTMDFHWRWDVDEVFNREVRAKSAANEKVLKFTFSYTSKSRSFKCKNGSGVVQTATANWTSGSVIDKIEVVAGAAVIEALAFTFVTKNSEELDEAAENTNAAAEQTHTERTYLEKLDHTGAGGDRRVYLGYSAPTKAGLNNIRHAKRLLNSITAQVGGISRATTVSWKEMDDPASALTGFKPYFLESITDPSGKRTTWKYQKQANIADLGLTKRAVQDLNHPDGLTYYDLVVNEDYIDQSYCSDRFCFVVLKKDKADLHVEVFRISGRGIGAPLKSFHSNTFGAPTVPKASDDWKFIGGKDWYVVFSERLHEMRLFGWNGSSFAPVSITGFDPAVPVNGGSMPTGVVNGVLKIFQSATGGIVISQQWAQEKETSVACPVVGPNDKNTSAISCRNGKLLAWDAKSHAYMLQKKTDGTWQLLDMASLLSGRIIGWYPTSEYDLYSFCQDVINETQSSHLIDLTGDPLEIDVSVSGRSTCSSGVATRIGAIRAAPTNPTVVGQYYLKAPGVGSIGWATLKGEMGKAVNSEVRDAISKQYALSGLSKNYMVFSYRPETNVTQCDDFGVRVNGEFDQLYDIHWIGGANRSRLLKTIQTSGVDNTPDDFNGNFDGPPMGGPLWWHGDVGSSFRECLNGCSSADCNMRRRRPFQVPLGVSASDNYFVYKYGWGIGVYTWADWMRSGFGLVSFSSPSSDGDVVVRNQRRILGVLQELSKFTEFASITIDPKTRRVDVSSMQPGFLVSLPDNDDYSNRIEQAKWRTRNVRPYSVSAKWNPADVGAALGSRVQAFYKVGPNGDIQYQDQSYNPTYDGETNNLFPLVRFIDGRFVGSPTGRYINTWSNSAPDQYKNGGYVATEIAVLSGGVSEYGLSLSKDVSNVQWIRFAQGDEKFFDPQDESYPFGFQGHSNSTTIHFASERSGIALLHASRDGKYYIRPFIVSPNRTGSIVNSWVVSEVVTSIGDPATAASSNVVRHTFGYLKATDDTKSGLSYNTLSNSLQSERTVVKRVALDNSVLMTSEVRFRTLGENENLTPAQMSLIGTDTLTRVISNTITGKLDSSQVWMRSVPNNEAAFSTRDLWINRVDSTKSVNCFRANNCMATVRKLYGYDLLSGTPGWVVDSAAAVPRKVSQSEFASGKMVRSYSWLLPTSAPGANLKDQPSSTPLPWVPGLSSAVPTGSGFVEYCSGNEWIPCTSWQWRPKDYRGDWELRSGALPWRDPTGNPLTAEGWEKVSEITDLRGTDVHESRTLRTGASTSSKDATYTSTFYEGKLNLPVGQVFGASRQNSAVFMAEDGNLASNLWTRGGWEFGPTHTLSNVNPHTGAYSVKVSGSYGPTRNIFPKDLYEMKAGFMVDAWIYATTTTKPNIYVQVRKAGLTDPVDLFATPTIGSKSGLILGGEAFKPNKWQLWQVHLSYDELFNIGAFGLPSTQRLMFRLWAGYGEEPSAPVAYVDDIVAYPDNATYELTSYDPTYGWPIGKVTASGQTVIYERDARGALVTARDEFGRTFQQSASQLPADVLDVPVGGMKQGFVAFKNKLTGIQVEELTAPPAVFIPNAKWVSGKFVSGRGTMGARIVVDQQGRYLIDVFRMQTGKMLMERWSTGALTEQAGLATDWLVGEFTGDGNQDLLFLRDDGTGSRNIYLLRSTGRGFEGPYLVGTGLAGGKYLAGNFDGSGVDDLVRVWNDAGSATMHVRLGNGRGFGSSVTWATKQGGYWDAQRWVAEDLNADGKVDLAKLYDCTGNMMCNESHISQGSSFNVVKVATNQGPYYDSQEWFVQRMNSDSYKDFGKFWNDGAGVSLEVHMSNGTTTSAPVRWLTQQGRKQGVGQWFFADVDNNGYDDIVMSVEK